MDEGLPIAYSVLKTGVPVLARDGGEVGTVARVVADEDEDIFHGLVISTPHNGVRFVPAEQVAELHERGVDLKIDRMGVAGLPAPEHSAPVYTEDPAGSDWSHWVRKFTGRGDWHHER
jgi:hypothetical protein